MEILIKKLDKTCGRIDSRVHLVQDAELFIVIKKVTWSLARMRREPNLNYDSKAP